MSSLTGPAGAPAPTAVPGVALLRSTGGAAAGSASLPQPHLPSLSAAGRQRVGSAVCQSLEMRVRLDPGPGGRR